MEYLLNRDQSNLIITNSSRASLSQTLFSQTSLLRISLVEPRFNEVCIVETRV